MSNNFELTAKLVNELFKRFDGIFSAAIHTLKENGSLSNAKHEWTLAFMDAGITSSNELNHGLKKARLSGNDFLPSMGKFIQWCRPTFEELGWPEPHEAFQMAVRVSYDLKHNVQSPIHPAVECARKSTGSTVFGRGDKVSEPVFVRAYEIIKARFINGESLEDINPPKAIESNRQQANFNSGFGGYEFEKPGLMKQYAGLSREENMEIIQGFIKRNGGSILKKAP